MPVTLGNAIINTHVRIAEVDTKSNVLSIGSSNNAFHGRLYLTTSPNLEIYMGNWDGSLTKLGGGAAWIAQVGMSTISVGDGATLEYVSKNIGSVSINSGKIEFGLSNGTVSGQVATWDGTSVVWSSPVADYITGITDTTSIDITVSSGNLSGVVKIDGAGDNAVSISGTGLYSKKYTAGSGINIDGSNVISINSLAVTDVTVDTVETTFSAWITGNYSGTEFNEGDVVILTAATGGRQTWIHNGGTAGTAADWTQIQDELSASEIRGYFSATSPLSYDSGTGAFSLAGLTSVGISGRIVTSTGSGWQYSTADDIAANITGAALTKVNDTNVTLTLGGSPSTALLDATSLTLGWTGQLSVSRGGTGASSLTGVVIGNGSSSMSGITGTANQLLRRNSSNTAYEFFTPTYISSNQTITLSGDATGSGTTSIPVTIANDAVTFAKFQNINSGILLGRSSVGSGDMEEITIGAGLSLSSGTLSATAVTDTNSWFTIGGSTKANATTGSQWHNGNTYIGDGSGAYTFIGAGTLLNVSGDIAVVGGTGGTRGLILQDDTNAYWRLTILSDGSLFTTTI